ncbi:MAG: Rrf2 family nitric oxide-sensitive transcriptional repressor [Planctomycetota bacterium]|jgi:Rrf2 family nitric oxide-sensitive transcriptional repressor
MRLTKQADYSLRILIYLAVYPDRLSRIEEISRAYDISVFHVGKIVHKLGQKGFASVQRGRNGGIKLGNSPDAINLSDVIREFEPDFNLVECFNPEQDACSLTSACKLKGILGEALTAFDNVLKSYTLADLIKGRKPARYRKSLEEI